MTRSGDSPPKTLDQFSTQGVTFYFAHRVLGDFARDLAIGLSQPVSEPVDVFVGIHLIPHPPDTGHLRLGIQTEQILDKNKKAMWRRSSREERLALATNYEALLDLSLDNRKAYRFLTDDLRRKIRFGPHIFPDQDLNGEFVDAPPLFVGWMNDRRRTVLAQLQETRKVDTLTRKAFGAELYQQLALRGAVLNIHFQQGVYSEYPRFLKACLAGKPFISEPMGDPLVEGVHYLSLDEFPTAGTTERLFAAIRDLAARYSFRSLVETIIREKVTGV